MVLIKPQSLKENEMKPLEGIRVLDLTHAHAGPICTLYLAAMGAEVLKIEPPWGEMTRAFPPLVKDISPYFSFLNRNKKGITLNLKTPRGLEIFKELVRKADVVVENFSPGTMEELGLGWETLKTLNPGIIYASISGFGHTGPWSKRRSFDAIAQAASGYMWLMRESVNPDGPPLLAPEAIADTIPGLTALAGILSALIKRSKTGYGDRVDVAQMDSMIAVLQSIGFWTMAGTTFKKALSMYDIQVSGCHRTRDGYVMISIPPGRMEEKLKEAIGLDELTWEGVAGWMAERSRDEVVELLSRAGIPVAPVLNLEEVLTNEQALAREMIVKLYSPNLGDLTLPGFPIKFLEAEGDLRKPAPALGEHNKEVYCEFLGISEAELEELRREGII